MSNHGLTPEQCVESTYAAWKAWKADKTVQIETWIDGGWQNWVPESQDPFFNGVFKSPARIKPEPKLRPYTAGEFNELVHRHRLVVKSITDKFVTTAITTYQQTVEAGNCTYEYDAFLEYCQISIDGGDWQAAGVME